MFVSTCVTKWKAAPLQMYETATQSTHEFNFQSRRTLIGFFPFWKRNVWRAPRVTRVFLRAAPVLRPNYTVQRAGTRARRGSETSALVSCPLIFHFRRAIARGTGIQVSRARGLKIGCRFCMDV